MDRSKPAKFRMLRCGIADLHLGQLLTNPLYFEERRVFEIRHDGLTHPILSPLGFTDGIGPATIKIEGMEKLCPAIHHAGQELARAHLWLGPVTCHLFMAQPGSPTFPMHSDPDDVFLYVVQGEKDVIVNDEHIIIPQGCTLFIPRGMPHQALNTQGSLMLSFGLESFAVDKF